MTTTVLVVLFALVLETFVRLPRPSTHVMAPKVILAMPRFIRPRHWSPLRQTMIICCCGWCGSGTDTVQRGNDVRLIATVCDDVRRNGDQVLVVVVTYRPRRCDPLASRYKVHRVIQVVQRPPLYSPVGKLVYNCLSPECSAESANRILKFKNVPGT